MLISVIIPAFNEEKQIGNTLQQVYSAFEQNKERGYSLEVIVCDNNSTDRTRKIASEMGARVVFEPVRQISRARNTGAKNAKGDWLLFIDADSYPPSQLISELFDLTDSNEYLGCGTTISVEDGTRFNKLRMERLNPMFRIFNLSGGAFLLCEAEAFRAIGGFSRELYAYEEIDLVIRLKRYGRKKGHKFTVLHRHPVVTSGRKGDYGVSSIFTLIASNIVAVILFVLHYILPEKVNVKLGSTLLGYWYDVRQ